ncbi:type VI secretion system Vgr family protein [Thalassomonas haliotis]|uniref:Type VI secretion system tip protein VgrG n=1 Tax=Thalassomonas haliotis TaxID=485448 RepID=A0ABY7VMC2_9GAMM|nr:type VI secretion system tip protein TssI/VgrG [Thalassomonas haliotis]WDE14140.1 type VI secretion system tip protein VgrG [Thalassomonas haliotis]
MATQNKRQFAISTPLASDKLLLYKLQGVEALAAPFHYKLELFSEDNCINSDELLAKSVTVSIATADGSPRYINGYVTEFYQMEPYGDQFRYFAEIRPWLWLLTLSENCRIFQKQSYPEIIKTVFDELGFSDVADHLSGSYPAKDYVVQFNESDFDFISRLLAQEGIFYFFKHSENNHILVLVDENSSLEKIGDIHYRASEYRRQQRQSAFIEQWQQHKKVCTGGVRRTDYDYHSPAKNLETLASDPALPSLSAFERFRYPGKYQQRSLGDNYTRLLMESENKRFETLSGASNHRLLTAGSVFNLTEYFREQQNRDYLAVSATLAIENDDFKAGSGEEEQDVYRCQFMAIPADTSFRPDFKVKKPIMYGPQTAVVVGKSGEEIWTDEFGRVKVQFHWDRQGACDENSSCWIRVSQVHAGSGFGGIDIPRIGEEVIVEFLGGDPDRPIITGRVYNGQNKSPNSLPAKAMVSGLKSRSTPKGSGDNSLMFDDSKDSELILLHGQHDMEKNIDHDETVTIGNDRSENVGNDESITIGNNRNESVAKDESISIGENRSLTVAKDNNEVIDKNETVTIGANRTLTVAHNLTETVDKDKSVTVSGEVLEKYEKSQSVTVGKDYLQQVDKKVVISAGDEICVTTGDAKVVMKKNGDITIKGKNITLDASGKVNIKAGGNVIIKGAKITQN